MENRAKIPEWIEKCENDILRYWLRGLYDAEGDKSGKRLRVWNKDKTILTYATKALKCYEIEAYGPYLDDKRRGVYVIEIPSKHRYRFFNEIGFEHPKLSRYHFTTSHFSYHLFNPTPPAAPESSGAHEWINEVPTVLAWGPVNTRSRCTGRRPPAGR